MKYYCGVDIGGMSVKCGIVDSIGNIVAKKSFATKPTRHYSDIVKDIAECIKLLMKEVSISISDLMGIGMGIPGTIDSKHGVIVYSNNINFENVPIVTELKKYLDVPVVIGNDANCAALGEVKFGSGKGYNDAVFVTLGTGVGSGIIINGDIYEGVGGAGAEAGHTVIKVGGEQCTCGRKGCWEAYASATALIRQTKLAMSKHPESAMHVIAKEQDKISGRTAFKAYSNGDLIAKKVVKQYVRYIAEGIINLVNVFRPEVILIGGGISNEGDYFIEMIKEIVDKESYGGSRNPQAKIVRAKLLNDAGILGAVALVI